MSFFVYIHTCPNGKRYVGVTTQKSPELRWRDGKGYPHNEHFQSAIQKYGWDDIIHEAFETKSAELMSLWEKILINYHKTIDRRYGYNKTSGGDSCMEFSDDHKQRISDGKKGRKRKPHTEEHKRKMSEMMKGRKRKPFTEEHKRKISEAKKGCKRGPFSETTRKKMSDAKKLYYENKRNHNK